MTAFTMEQYLSLGNMTTNSNNEDAAIITPGPYDVLCGRCKSSFNHVGNRRFRVTISMNVERYLATRSRHEKSALIVSVVRMLREEVGARFLKKKGNAYVELGEKQAREKVGHALRDLAVHQQQSTMTDFMMMKQKEEAQKQQPVVAEAKSFDDSFDCDIFSESLEGLFAMCEQEEQDELSFEPIPCFVASKA